VIGVVTTSYPRGPDDGAGGFVRERVRQLVRQGYAVEIIAAGAPASPPEDAVTRIGSFGLFYAGGAPEILGDAHPGRRMRAWAGALGFSLAMLGQLAIRRGRWRAVESHWLLPCGLLAAAALPGIPHRSHVHGGDVFLLGRLPWGDSLARNLCRSGPELVFASAHLRDGFASLAGQPPESLGACCRVEPAPFDRSVFFQRDLDERNRLRARLGFARPTVLGAGRLVSIKGFDVLIAALATIPAGLRPDLVLAGGGPELQNLARQARRHNLRVRFTGDLGQRALSEMMAAADLFVHPCRTLLDGRTEGMPLVVREASACGLPVIAAASGGLCELRGLEGYCLVDPGDVTGLAGAIRKLTRRHEELE
jgi:glycosyltransferase involved in cell wall biosynthesis